MRNAVLAIIVALVTGCATVAVPLSQSAHVPAAQMQRTERQSERNSVRLVVARDTGGHVWMAHTWLDGAPLAWIDKGEHFVAWVPPGQHELRVQEANKLQEKRPLELSFSAAAGEVRVFRIGWDSAGTMTVLRDREAER